MESLATIKGNVRDILQNHITADIVHFVETHGEANSNICLLSNQPDMPALDEPLHRPAQQLT